MWLTERMLSRHCVSRPFEPRDVLAMQGNGLGQQAHRMHGLAQVVRGGAQKAVLLRQRRLCGSGTGLAVAFGQVPAVLFERHLAHEEAVRSGWHCGRSPPVHHQGRWAG